MGTLQDQLKKAGLANDKQAAKARRAKNHKEKMIRQGHAVEDESIKLVREAEVAKLEKDRELNRQQQAELEARALQAQIRELVDLNRIVERGDAEFSFTAGTRIRTLRVREEERRALVAGRLAVVRLDGAKGPADEPRYEIVPRSAADKIAERDVSRVVLANTRDAHDAADDEYAGFEVPDDLMW